MLIMGLVSSYLSLKEFHLITSRGRQSTHTGVSEDPDVVHNAKAKGPWLRLELRRLGVAIVFGVSRERECERDRERENGRERDRERECVCVRVCLCVSDPV